MCISKMANIKHQNLVCVLIAVCLDGTLPGYHLHRGHGSGANSWLIQLEVSKKKKKDLVFDASGFSLIMFQKF